MAVPVFLTATTPIALRGLGFAGTALGLGFLAGFGQVLGASVGARVSRKLFRTEFTAVKIHPRADAHPAPPATAQTVPDVPVPAPANDAPHIRAVS
jgi:hypothetical protein